MLTLHKVLWPNKPPEFCHIEDDENAWHFGVFDDVKLISVASLYPKDNSVRLRKFATIEDYQGRGIGSSLLTYMLDISKERGMSHFWCDARESAVDFYQRFGMVPEGNRFYKSKVSYFKMSKKLL